MADDEIFAAVAGAIREETEQGGLEISGLTTAADVPGWDSLTHARIVMNVERRLGIRLSVRHTYDAANVGELVGLIAAQAAGAPPSA